MRKTNEKRKVTKKRYRKKKVKFKVENIKKNEM